MSTSPSPTHPIFAAIRWNADGLVPVIVQDAEKNDVLMQAWMNAEALAETLSSRRMCYWSRSRQSLWRKGERSGQTQQLVGLWLDCDGDCLLAKVQQTGVPCGVACHTGRRSCYFNAVTADGLEEDRALPVLIAPDVLYKD